MISVALTMLALISFDASKTTSLTGFRSVGGR